VVIMCCGHGDAMHTLKKRFKKSAIRGSVCVAYKDDLRFQLRRERTLRIHG
jgi:hypothetical protein